MRLKKVAVVMAIALLAGLTSVTLAQAQSPDQLGKAITDNYMEALQKDANLGKIIKDFNIITQYALFDLLKKQSPKEAERLGIK
jgi:uncharacterized protein YdbL (DUF1318 family)